MEKIVKTNQVSLSTRSFGLKDSPAILLIAGATVSMLYWDEAFCNKLSAKGFFVIRYDHRDTGRSTNYGPGKPAYDIVDLTGDAIAILDDYQLPKASLMGMSLGGLIAQIASIKYPQRVSALILLSSGPWGDSDPQAPEMDQRIVEFQQKAEKVNWQKEQQVVNYLLEGARLMSGDKIFDDKKYRSYLVAEYERASNYKSMYNHAQLSGGEQYWNKLDHIHAPVLIIHGTKDHIWDFKHAAFLASKLEKSDLLPLAGTGHELHPLDYQKITTKVQSFLIQSEV